MKWIQTAVFLLFSVACVHSGPPLEFTGYPQNFFTEQSLIVKGPSIDRELRAQVQRTVVGLEVVLVESSFGIPLLRVSFPPGGVARISYQAPQMTLEGAPLQRIADAIQMLYNAHRFEARGDQMILEHPEGLLSYRLSRFAGKENCVFPQEIDLQFADKRFAVKIETLTMNCETK